MLASYMQSMLARRTFRGEKGRAEQLYLKGERECRAEGTSQASWHPPHHGPILPHVLNLGISQKL